MNIEDHIAESFSGLINQAQENELKAFEARCKTEREALAALRREADRGLSAAELIAAIDDDDPTKKQEKLNAELAAMQSDVAAAVAAAKEKEKEQTDAIQHDRFPPPPTGPVGG